MKRLAVLFLISLFVLGILVVFPVPTAHAETSSTNPNYAYKYYKEIDFSNATTGPQVFSFLIYNGIGNDSGTTIYVNCSNFPNDIRFTTSLNNTTYLPQYIEHTIDISDNKIVYTNPARVYVKVPAETQKIYLLYGNPNATLYSNGMAVFTYFDDFTNHTRLLNDYSILQNSGTVAQNTTLGFVDIKEVSGKQNISGIVYKKQAFDPIADPSKKIALFIKFSLIQDTSSSEWTRLGFTTTTTPTYDNSGFDLTFVPYTSNVEVAGAVLGSVYTINTISCTAGSTNFYTLKLIYLESGAEWYYLAKNANNYIYVYNNTKATTNSAWYPAALIPMFGSATTEIILDYMAVDVSYTQNIQLNISTEQTEQLNIPPEQPSNSSNNTNNTGGSGTTLPLPDPIDPKHITAHVNSFLNNLIAFAKTHIHVVGIAIVIVVLLFIIRR